MKAIVAASVAIIILSSLDAFLFGGYYAPQTIAMLGRVADSFRWYSAK